MENEWKGNVSPSPGSGRLARIAMSYDHDEQEFDSECGSGVEYYPEAMPDRLRWAAMLHGHYVPEKSFAYLEINCGAGLTLLYAAAAHPESHFVGLGGSARQFERSRVLAREAGLSNIEFVEGDYLQPAFQAGGLGRRFDYVVVHGIASWIPSDARSALLRFANRALKVGGLFYTSYNTLPGSLGALTYGHFARFDPHSDAPSEALKAAHLALLALQNAALTLLPGMPALAQRLETLGRQNLVDLLSRSGRSDWRPIFVTEMLEDLRVHGLSYLGTATLAEAFDSALAPELRELIEAQPTVAIREQVRDLALMQVFRRDLAVRGRQAMPLVEQLQRFSTIRLRSNPLVPRPVPRSAADEPSGDTAIRDRLLARLDAARGSLRLGDLVEEDGHLESVSEAVQAISALIHGGQVAIARNTPNPDAARRLNRVLIEEALGGSSCSHLAVPDLGGAVPVSYIDLLIAAFHDRGADPCDIPDIVRGVLLSRNRMVTRDGVPVRDPELARGLIGERLEHFLLEILPHLP